MKVEQHGAVTVVHVDEALHGYEINLMLTSDRHHDSTHCNRELEKKHLEEAKKRNAFIIDCGDLFDAMQG